MYIITNQKRAKQNKKLELWHEIELLYLCLCVNCLWSHGCATCKSIWVVASEYSSTTETKRTTTKNPTNVYGRINNNINGSTYFFLENFRHVANGVKKSCVFISKYGYLVQRKTKIVCEKMFTMADGSMWHGIVSYRIVLLTRIMALFQKWTTY